MHLSFKNDKYLNNFYIPLTLNDESFSIHSPLPPKALITDSGEEEKNNLLNNKGSILFCGCADCLH